MEVLRVGWAQIDITPDRPVYIFGQIYTRISQYVHDPLTATALAIENGEEQVVFLSIDMTMPPSAAIQERLRDMLSGVDGLDVKKLVISATHTHNAFSENRSLWDEDDMRILGGDILPPIDVPDNILAGEEAEEFLAGRFAEVVSLAWRNRRPGGISGASDYAVVGFNRRPVFGTNDKEEAVMYGVSARDDFLRYESGSDCSAEMLYLWDDNNRLTGVAVCIPCPSQVFELHSFISADYWHYVRQEIRKRLGNIYVLPLCGASGDQNPIDLTRISKNNWITLPQWGAQAGEVFRNFDMAEECQKIALRVTEAVCRGYDSARNEIETFPAFKHSIMRECLPLYMVTHQTYEEASARLELFISQHKALMTSADEVAVFEPVGVIKRWLRQQEKQTVETLLRAIRLGNTAICTNPFELFTEFSLRIKARACSPRTMVIQLTDGSCGYLPTKAALSGGSYSSQPASIMCGPESGDRLVDICLAAINQIWR